MNELQIFQHKKFGSVRVIREGNTSLFCGSDVANALGYSNSRKALADHCKGVTKRDTPTESGTQEMSFIPIGDLYRMVARCKLPDAAVFESWIFDRVIPSVMETGSYSIGFSIPKTLPEALRLAADLAEQVEQQNRWLPLRKRA